LVPRIAETPSLKVHGYFQRRSHGFRERSRLGMYGALMIVAAISVTTA
jgi:hypothetical protein